MPSSGAPNDSERREGAVDDQGATRKEKGKEEEENNTKQVK